VSEEQLCFEEITRPPKAVRKIVRKVSRVQYAVLREAGALPKRVAQVLRCLSWRRNATGQWSTAAELARWMCQHGEIPRDDSRLVAPRLTFLGPGERLRDGTVRGGGLIEALPLRTCRVTGKSAHPWRVRERGSQQQRFEYGGVN
jgi:hypothetical protein